MYCDDMNQKSLRITTGTFLQGWAPPCPISTRERRTHENAVTSQAAQGCRSNNANYSMERFGAGGWFSTSLPVHMIIFEYGRRAATNPTRSEERRVGQE